jgi:hypothetical protein
MELPMQSPDSETAKSIVTGNTPKNNPKDRQNQPPSIESGDKSDIPPAPPQSGNSKHGENQPNEWRKNSIERALFIVEILGLAGLIWYCFLTKGELRVFDSERKTMENEFRAGETNSQRQLEVLQRQVDEMQKDARLEQRAWIAPVQTTRWSDDNFSNSFYFILCYKNIGRTPAPHHYTSLAISTNLNSITKFSTEPPSNFSTQPLFPGIEDRVNSAPMPISVCMDAWNGNVPLYVYGNVVYDDIFRINHWVRFCWVVDVRTGKQYPAQVGNDCDTNN